MCLLVIAWRTHPQYRLVVAANRDEFHDRPTASLAWWNDDPRILAGRDLRADGTWLGVTRAGRFGIITNFRDLESPPAPDAPSRGGLVPRFLAERGTTSAFLEQLGSEAGRLAGFSLLLGDADELHYYSNRGEARSRSLSPGVYGLSNHALDTPWPKLVRTRQRFAQAIGNGDPAAGELFDILGDREPAPYESHPDTGLPPDWERALSAPFVVHERYGTRCSTVVITDGSGRTAVHERRFDAKGAQTGATRMEFAGPGASE